ncbi:hypothetical protein PG994_011904 [Apiospora phragmitis]|uniref:Uncharacterized protein n=1 Tax=Apiospora phragmitis TaxID=2905665 RepID=A0ABR1TU43_9PEZI
MLKLDEHRAHRKMLARGLQRGQQPAAGPGLRGQGLADPRRRRRRRQSGRHPLHPYLSKATLDAVGDGIFGVDLHHTVGANGADGGAGQDSSVDAASWSTPSLATNPEVQDKLRAEVQEAAVIENLSYLHIFSARQDIPAIPHAAPPTGTNARGSAVAARQQRRRRARARLRTRTAGRARPRRRSWRVWGQPHLLQRGRASARGARRSLATLHLQIMLLFHLVRGYRLLGIEAEDRGAALHRGETLTLRPRGI